MSRPKGPRGLRPEEEELWNIIAARTRPLRKPIAKRPVPAPLQPAPDPVPARPAPMAPFRLGARAKPRPLEHDLSPPPSETLREGPVRMDHKSHRKMVRGKIAPEARIDLHGMTQADAHPALHRFIAGAHADGLRLVLVITGKGKSRDEPGPMPPRHGVLRHLVPQWLSSPALRGFVLQVTESHVRHGGAGAYYVYLRRQR